LNFFECDGVGDGGDGFLFEARCFRTEFFLCGEIFGKFTRERVGSVAVLVGKLVRQFRDNDRRNVIRARVQGLDALGEARGEVEVGKGGLVKEGGKERWSERVME